MELDFHFGTALVEVCADERVLVRDKRTTAQKNVQRTQNCPEQKNMPYLPPHNWVYKLSLKANGKSEAHDSIHHLPCNASFLS